MKILMIGQSPKAGGGIAEVSKTLSLGIPIINKNIQISIISTCKKKGSPSPLLFISALINILKAYLHENIDGAHLHLASRGSTFRKIIISRLLSLLKIPYVIQLHSGDYPYFYSKLHALTKRCIYKMLVRASNVVVLSQETLKWASDEFHLDNLIIIPNGTPDHGTGPSFPKRKNDLIFVGRITKTKGIEELIRALHLIKPTPPNLTIVGNGEIEEYSQLAQNLGVHHFISFTNWMPKREVFNLLKTHKIFVLPSWFEGLPISMLEAMSAATTVIATEVGGIGDVIKNKSNGLLVKPKDVDQLANAIKLCLSDFDLAEKMALKGRDEYLSKYSNEIMCMNYESLYNDMIKKPRIYA